MIPNWTNHLDEREARQFKAYLYSSRGILERQQAILKEMENNLDSKELSPEVYDSPSWAAKQADNNGYRRCLRQIHKLLTLDPKDK